MNGCLPRGQVVFLKGGLSFPLKSVTQYVSNSDILTSFCHLSDIFLSSFCHLYINFLSSSFCPFAFLSFRLCVFLCFSLFVFLSLFLSIFLSVLAHLNLLFIIRINLRLLDDLEVLLGDGIDGCKGYHRSYVFEEHLQKHV